MQFYKRKRFLRLLYPSILRTVSGGSKEVNLKLRITSFLEYVNRLLFKQRTKRFGN